MDPRSFNGKDPVLLYLESVMTDVVWSIVILLGAGLTATTWVLYYILFIVDNEKG